MKKSHHTITRLLAMLLALCLLPACGLGETAREPYRFMDISYEDMTVAEAQALLESHAVHQEHGWVMDFYGYPMYVNADNGDEQGLVIQRIRLNDAGEAWSDEEHYRDYTARDVEIFMNLDKQLTELYGEPDRRYFGAGNGKYQLNKGEWFMFPDGQWSEERLMAVFDRDDHIFRAFSVWNNVILELWTRGDWETQFGYCNILNVNYYAEEQKSLRDLIIIDYPYE